MPFLNGSVPAEVRAAIDHWYQNQWRILVGRLRYPGSRRYKRAVARVLKHWPPDALDEARKQAAELTNRVRLTT